MTTEQQEAKPARAMPYRIGQRLADSMAGWRDGRAGIPDLSSVEGDALTPYHSVRDQQFTGAAERERLAMERAIAPFSELVESWQETVVEAEQEAADAHKQLEQLPPVAPESVLSVRNALEASLDANVARVRRQREYDRKRDRVVAVGAAAGQQARRARIEHSRAAAGLATIRRIYAIRVRSLHAHAERRCHTYERHLLCYHPDAASLYAHLPCRRPTLPQWVLNLD